MNTFARRYVIPALVALVVAISPLSGLYAQEATLEPVDAPVAPIVVEDGGTVIMETSEQAPIVSNEIVLALVAAVGLLVGIIMGIRRGGTPDQVAAAEIERYRQDRAAMGLLERELAAKDAMTRMAFDTFTGFIKLIAPLTPLLSDDAASKFLEDLQKQGPPEVPQVDTSGTFTPPGSLSQPKRD